MIHIIIIALIVNMIISQVIATSVRNRQISSTRVFWISFLLSPLVGMFVAIMAPEVKPDEIKESSEVQLNFPKYDKNNDKLIGTISKYLNIVLYVIFFIYILIFIVGIIK